jgi:hypothetical protein
MSIDDGECTASAIGGKGPDRLRREFVVDGVVADEEESVMPGG